ncbi:hypothetical protein [Streptomyces uncialis]|uniref:hypothetical protein n=1 Tax=Streptomyces uncialis TaxID=1048205 RepID=UPI0033D58F7B
MSVRHVRKNRPTMTAAAITAGLVLLVAGCGDGGEAKDGKSEQSASPAGESDKQKSPEEPTEPTGSTEAQVLAEAKDGDITVKIETAVRDSGGFVTVSGTVRNDGNGSWLGENWKSDEHELRTNGGSLAGASLVDRAGKKKYLVLRDTSGRCLCTKFSRQMRSGDSASWFAQFPAPPAEAKVDFQVGSMPPAAIEISEGE